MTHCEDCGTRMTENICPNCQEELYIHDFQIQGDGCWDLSEEFLKQVDEQRSRTIHRTLVETGEF